MDKYLKYLVVLILALCFGCTSTTKHLINNEEYLNIVDSSFTRRMHLAVKRDTNLFSVFNEELSTEQSEALKFLYAFMPLSDLADYEGEFFLANTDMSLLARTQVPWGQEISEDIFLHYVLPCRVNNENLDSFRIVFYDEIMDRIKGKDISEAALEINHWCHEKVNYQPSDIRTSSPMCTMLSARGRCGEESTFTVAALRTAGIPARQVYTPRWAHSDDNHAWVEIWIKGKWYYMGACEPEPVLDRGWFTEPARRAMLVDTKSFGAPYGKENSINIYENFTEVNNLSKYAVTKKIFVKVLDKSGIPVKDAIVEFKLYNYAEFYSLASVSTDKNGLCHFETGLGDLLIWASRNEDFNFKKISVSETDTLVLKIDRKSGGDYSFDLDLDVPDVKTPLAGPSPELIERNAARISDENQIRQKYVDSWMKREASKHLAMNLKLDTLIIAGLIDKSMGNYNSIEDFLVNTPDSLKERALTLLEILSEKDLRDIGSEVLTDHLRNSAKPGLLKDDKLKNLYQEYILNPRIANEMIVSWRGYFRRTLPLKLRLDAPENPLLIKSYLNENIKIDNDDNYYKTPLTPRGVNELKVSDSNSRSICFVAICRSLGIPSRLEPGSNTPQYFFDGKWNDVYFADQQQPVSEKGYLKLHSTDTKPVPEYYIQFTIARFENGRYITLEYDYNKKVSDFRDELALTPGSYMMVTGNRLNDSKILSSVKIFDLAENEHKTLEVKMRKDVPDKKIVGRLNIKNILHLFDKTDSGRDLSQIQKNINTKGAVIIWIDPNGEPTKHIFNDLPRLKDNLDAWGGYFIFLNATKEKNFTLESIKGLPEKSLLNADNQMDLFRNSVEVKDLPEIRMPFVLISDKSGNILFTSTGYRVGIGEQILKYLK